MTDPSELEAIRQTALDYIESWYTGDAGRMERCLHPDLAKRTPFPDPRGFDRLEPISALALVIATRRGAGRRTPLEQQHTEITLQDVCQDLASVRVDSAEMVDFLHLARLNGEWLIVNALWQRRKAE